MDFLQNPKQFIISISMLTLLITPCYSAHYIDDFVYKGCANQKFPVDPSGNFSQNLDNLFDTLVSQSSSAKFYKTTAGQGQFAIIGLFQCRGDAINSDCKECVSQLPTMTQKLCGGDVIAARIQLQGCYLRYEVAGFKQVSPTELLFKSCGSVQASGAGYQERLDTALGEIAKGIGGGGNGNGNGFYSGEYQSVYVVGQCEGDLGLGSNGDCVSCVKSAGQRAKSECDGAISGEIYLQQCYISYSNGVPIKLSSSPGKEQNTHKTVAVVLGVILVVGLLFSCLLYARSVYTKRRRHAKYGGGGFF